MTLSFCSFSSGSSGNSYLIRSECTGILVDAGISGKKIIEGLSATQTPEEQVKALLITHEHIDHVKSLKVITKKLSGIKAYANEKTWQAIEGKVNPLQQETFVTGEAFMIGDILVKPFPISHDAAEPVGFSFFADEKQITVVTDTGYITEEIFQEMKTADILALEANHDENMLKMGRYPWSVKQRILGDKGHLSNTMAGKCICKILDDCKQAREKKQRRILLAHLSRENNFPEMAFQTIKNVLEESEHYLGSNLQIHTIIKDEISLVYEV
ncbi:MBL fold metallo-hydrolase [Clostridium aminobutyricum]|uniref:MBL fold metallo-hydrolase n=1 Tax=Clostridium aminobutyricum TaxID=33953 RepID=A0A939D9M1_CLOAM|nr:MBL fold metallo-hydrolase [Clostridium aminobutyricum]MBN7773303.1 MBL fold metallo-hydrolase [Clostridium aminobutyricum]